MASIQLEYTENNGLSNGSSEENMSSVSSFHTTYIVFFSNSVNKKREKLSVRKSAVDPAGFISFTVQYIEGV